MRKRPYTTKEFFDLICERLELPDILDYHLSSHEDDVLDTYEFEFDTKLNFGGSEGIYLSISTEEYSHSTNQNVFKPLGTFKTLLTSKEAMEIMAKLAGDFIYEAHNFVNDNIDNFSWRGFQICKNAKPILECSSIERAKLRIEQMKSKGSTDKFTIINLATRKEEKI